MLKIKDKLFKNRFNKLGISDEALNSKVYDSPNCDRLLFSISKDSTNDGWYLDYDLGLDIDWGVKTLLDVLKEIEKVSKSKIFSFGLNKYDYADNNGFLTSVKVNRSVSLSECGDSFNLQLGDGNFYHLYFCESK